MISCTAFGSLLMVVALSSHHAQAHSSGGVHDWSTQHLVEQYYHSGEHINLEELEPEHAEQIQLERCLVQDTVLLVTMRYLHPDISVDRIMKILSFIYDHQGGHCEYEFSRALKRCYLPASMVIQADITFDEIFAILGLERVSAETFLLFMERDREVLNYSHNYDRNSYLLRLSIDGGALCFMDRYRAPLINGDVFDFTPYLKKIGIAH